MKRLLERNRINAVNYCIVYSCVYAYMRSYVYEYKYKMIERNSLLNGDCLEVMKMIEDNSVDLVCTDPPYKITSRGNCGNSGGMMAKDISMKGKVFDNNDCNVKDWMPEIFRVLKNGSHCYIMCNQINLIEYLNVATQCGFHFIKSLIWDKQTKIMGRAYMSQFEYILFFRKGDFKQVNDCGISDIISIKNKKPKDKYGKKSSHNSLTLDNISASSIFFSFKII
jgi:DNA modification methylase